MNHGTGRRYDAGCRCSACKQAKLDKDRRRRERLKRLRDEKPELVPHGTQNGYSKYSCRCDASGWAADHRREFAARHPLAVAEHSRRWRAAHPEASAAYTRQQSMEAGIPRNHGKLWTGPELELVVTRTDLPLTELARRLGRTRTAVALARLRATHDPKYVQVAGVPQPRARKKR